MHDAEYWLYKGLITAGILVGVKLLSMSIYYIFPKGKIRDALFKIR